MRFLFILVLVSGTALAQGLPPQVGSNTGDVTIGTANGLSLSNQALSFGLTDGGVANNFGVGNSLNVTGLASLGSVDAGATVATSVKTGTLNATGASTLAGTTATTLNTSGLAQLQSVDAGATVTTSLVTGPATLGAATATTFGASGLSSLASVDAGTTVATSLTTGGPLVVGGVSTLGSATVTGYLTVTDGGVSVVGPLLGPGIAVTSVTSGYSAIEIPSGTRIFFDGATHAIGLTTSGGGSYFTSGLTINGGLAVNGTSASFQTIQIAATALTVCQASSEGAVYWDILSGVATAHATRECTCRSDGASGYKWYNKWSATPLIGGTTTTCPD